MSFETLLKVIRGDGTKYKGEYIMKKKVITIDYHGTTREEVFKTFESAKDASEYYKVSYDSVKKACKKNLANCKIKHVAFLYEEDYKDVVVDELYLNIQVAFLEEKVFGK